ncbi:zinc-binding dehydrogenase [Microbacterium sp.]|uniref:zinc-binding dehydrogenase n=1 Tax=Microbacterium sp. TaxID=51671 RepID=UPI0037CBC129
MPQLAPGHVLVEVRAAGVTFPDLLLTYGRYQETPVIPFTLGGEFAGVVVSAAPDSEWSAGDRVVGSSANCAFAEYAAVPSERLLPLPETVSFDHGACLPANYLTMLFALTERGRMRPGERVLVHGASGGVGGAAIRLALALGAGEVFAVTSSSVPGIDERVTVVDVADFAAEIRRCTAGAGVDVVVDPVGGERPLHSASCLAPGGRLLIVGFAGGEIPIVDLRTLPKSNVELVGVGWGAHLARHPEALQPMWAQLVRLLEGRPDLLPVIDRVAPLDETASALRALEAREARGRIVLRPQGSA